MISVVVAIGNNGEIGNKGQLLWHLPADLKKFKQTTMGHHMIMGRKTFESIGKPLPGRTTIIVTRNKDYAVNGCLVTSSVEEAIEVAKQAGEQEVMIVGGGEIYKQSLPLAQRIYLTEVDFVGEADTFFPRVDTQNWDVIETEDHPSESGHPAWSFKVLQRKK
ncbi:MAG: dihydrofolate reductase [Deltaproteobacteria bacterium]|nr:MAG: dihydrofolate reductase [Deltaproteobacteria bacterium]